VTKEQIMERINTIKADMEVLKANYSKLEGHLEESNFWLQGILAKEKPPKPVGIDLKEEPKAEHPKRKYKKSLADLHQAENI
jgi:hypothetical protein